MIPNEVILLIFQFLSPSEVIRLRLVSKRFSVLSRDTRLWRTLYASARLPRPPGPFLWKSTRSLERTLVHSERVARTWTSQPVNIVSRIYGPRRLPPTRPKSYVFLFGKLLIWYDKGQILSEDIETGHHQVVWNGDLRMLSIHACSPSTPDGLRVLLFVDYDKQGRQTKLLMFSPNDDTSSTLGPVTREMNLSEEARLYIGVSFSSALFYFDGPRVAPTVIDPQTYALHRFAPSHLSPPTGIVDNRLGSQVVLSGPYIVALRFEHESLGTGILVQIYVVPTLPPIDSTMGELRVTHEAVTHVLADPAELPFLLQPLRDPVIDPLTGDTTLRFLRKPSELPGYETPFFCVDFTMPATGPSSTQPLPLTLNIRELFVIHGKVMGFELDASSDGHGRGIIVFFTAEPEGLRYQCCKFSIDASGETCTAVVGDTTSAPEYLISAERRFDSVRGRVCYRDWIPDETKLHSWHVEAKVFDLQ